MAGFKVLFDKNWKLSAWLLVCSFGIYFFYFHHLLLNINSLLSSLTSDALKNYYTFFYHIVNDQRPLHFEGMNYPFGDHVVYTDCQPLIALLLRLLPFTHPYLAGILHTLIFFSYIVTPLIIYRILLQLEVDKLCAFFTALAISVLSPQYWRLDGHFALTYECMIPFSIWLLLRLFREGKTLALCWLTAYNMALFLIHPYLGFGVSVFCFLSLFTFGFIPPERKRFFLRLGQSVISGLLPIAAFKLFLFLTDLHQNRTQEPYGIDISVASFASVFVANFGPFMKFMKTYISSGPQEFEGLSYLGFFTVTLITVFIASLPFTLKKLRIKAEIISFFVAALLLLFFSFGLHNQLLLALHLHISLFDQFRSLGRFAWFFYYVAPLSLVVIFYHSFRSHLKEKPFRYISGAFAMVFLFLNMLEANDMLQVYVDTAFKDRNIFRKELLTMEEKTILNSIETHRPQAIIPLPLYYLGSEVYSRIGGGNSMLPSMLYSFHASLPIVGGSLSRTSITETENGIELLNAYKRNRKAISLSGPGSFLVLKTRDHLLPDEERLFKKAQVDHEGDSLSFAYILKSKLQDPGLPASVYTLKKNSTDNRDSSNVFYIHAESRQPFLPSNISLYGNIFILDSNILRTGNYVISLHYYFKEKTYKDVYNHLIIAKTTSGTSEWKYAKAIRIFSGFYEGFAVFEYTFHLESDGKYEFMLKGEEDKPYRISDFMIRPDTCNVMVILNGKDTLLNNFPLKR